MDIGKVERGGCNVSEDVCSLQSRVDQGSTVCTTYLDLERIPLGDRYLQMSYVEKSIITRVF